MPDSRLTWLVLRRRMRRKHGYFAMMLCRFC